MMPQSLCTQVWLNRALINNESEVINALIKPSFTNTPLTYNQILTWAILSNKVWSNLHNSDIIIHLEFYRNAEWRGSERKYIILFWHFFPSNVSPPAEEYQPYIWNEKRRSVTKENKDHK